MLERVWCAGIGNRESRIAKAAPRKLAAPCLSYSLFSIPYSLFPRQAGERQLAANVRLAASTTRSVLGMYFISRRNSGMWVS